MKRSGSAAASSIAELFMGTALSYLGEPELGEDCDDFSRFEDRNVAHGLSHGNVLHPNELGLKLRFAFFKKHGDNLLQIAVKLVERFTLRVCARKTRDETDEKPCLRTTFDNG